MQQPYNFLLLFMVIIYSCTQASEKQEVKDKDTSSPATHIAKVSQKSATVLPNSDTLTINSTCAVLYQPDSLQIEKRAKAVGEENFRGGADDYMYYMHLSNDYLSKQKLPVVNAKGKKYLKFLVTGENAQLVKLDTLQDLWGVYLFTPGKAPHFTDIISIEDEYKGYFKQAQ